MSALPILARPAALPPLVDRDAALALAFVPGVGCTRWRTLLERDGGDAGRALARLPADAVRAARAESADARERARRSGLALHLLGDPDYPPRLLEVDDPPPVLWSLGDPALVAPSAAARVDVGPAGDGRAAQAPTVDPVVATRPRPVVTIVGTRAPTTYGRSTARTLAATLARAGALVVSGMARGIDGCAHEAALEVGAPSVAVLGTGADVPYPAAHRALHGRLARTGLVLSELPPGAAASPGSFPRRNRLLAALADLVLVVEAGHRSGALITAAIAADLGRTVAAVPGPIDAPSAGGSNALLRDGALVIATVEDALAAVGLLLPGGQERGGAGRAERASPEPGGLSVDERSVWAALARPAGCPDELVARTGLPAARCAAALTTLELAGLVAAGFGGAIARR